jgi:predicted DNA binding CopG/RHH family protein
MKNVNLKPIPVFKNEDEERDFWATADTSEYFDFQKSNETIFTNLKSSRESISLRLPTPLLSKLKLIANRKDIPYQSLIKTYLAESVSKDFKSL